MDVLLVVPHVKEAIAAANDGLAGAAYETLSAAGKDANVIITGQDADLSACVRIKQGRQATSHWPNLQN